MISRRLCITGALWLFVACPAIGFLHAQQPDTGTFDFDQAREPVVKLDGLWRFHPGDDPRWAQPGFDDSAWAVIHGDRGWEMQGYKGLSGYAWYRARVVMPAGTEPFSLYIPTILTDYQVFVDGMLLQGCGGGKMDDWTANRAVVCNLPQQTFMAGQIVTLAIRVWQSRLLTPLVGGGMWFPPLIGVRSLIDARWLADVDATAWSQTGRVVVATLTLLSSISALLLFLFRREQREYLWFGILAAADAILWMVSIQISFFTYPGIKYGLVNTVASMVEGIAMMLFCFHLLRARRDWLFWLGVSGLVCGLAVWPLEVGEWVGLSSGALITSVVSLPYIAWILVLVISRVVRGDTHGRFLAGPILLGCFSVLTTDVLAFLYSCGWYRGQANWFFKMATWPFPINVPDLGQGLFLMAMLGILIYRFSRTSVQEERMAGELSAAHAVQHILIPEAARELPGFAIESVYRPANEVGGDFFQILPTASGGVLAAIGDVSGKGVPAAIVVANAGHLSPYVDGREMDVGPGLPLGISAEATYEETEFHLEESARLTLFTDGVVEARSRTGELYGFDRTAAVAGAAASHIAAAAQAFGQEDDITVVSVTRAAVPQTAAV